MVFLQHQPTNQISDSRFSCFSWGSAGKNGVFTLWVELLAIIWRITIIESTNGEDPAAGSDLQPNQCRTSGVLVLGLVRMIPWEFRNPPWDWLMEGFAHDFCLQKKLQWNTTRKRFGILPEMLQNWYIQMLHDQKPCQNQRIKMWWLLFVVKAFIFLLV